MKNKNFIFCIILLVIIVLINFVKLNFTNLKSGSSINTTFALGQSVVDDANFPSITWTYHNSSSMSGSCQTMDLTNNSPNYVSGFPQSQTCNQWNDGDANRINFCKQYFYNDSKQGPVGNNIIVSCYDITSGVEIPLSNNTIGTLNISSNTTSGPNYTNIDYTLYITSNNNKFNFEEAENSIYVIKIGLQNQIVPVPKWGPTVFLYKTQSFITNTCSSTYNPLDCEGIPNSNILDQNKCRGCQINLQLNGIIPPYGEAPEIYIQCYDTDILNYNLGGIQPINGNDLYLITDFIGKDTIDVTISDKSNNQLFTVPVSLKLPTGNHISKISVPFVSAKDAGDGGYSWFLIVEYKDFCSLQFFNLSGASTIIGLDNTTLDSIYNNYVGTCDYIQRSGGYDGIPDPWFTAVIGIWMGGNNFGIRLDNNSGIMGTRAHYGFLSYLANNVPNFSISLYLYIGGSTLDQHEITFTNDNGPNFNLLSFIKNTKSWQWWISYDKDACSKYWGLPMCTYFTVRFGDNNNPNSWIQYSSS